MGLLEPDDVTLLAMESAPLGDVRLWELTGHFPDVRFHQAPDAALGSHLRRAIREAAEHHNREQPADKGTGDVEEQGNTD